MPRTRGGFKTRRRRKRLLKKARGYYGARSRLYTVANEAVEHALQYAYRDRRTKKREFRSLWIVRINAAVRESGMTYSRFIAGIKKAGVELDRKSLADIAYNDPGAFGKIIATAKKAVSA
ncbi:50S ribosomal protein L20 [bacterium BMS3Abin07]|nr:50S ribosomal protein L20 [bacterium BMS3Abin07]GBE31488.1 50S ribosomal protein L20 [bacterium BMS3Bbin05]HDO23276.1 50S ribosomal protein L20 [Nitrospirota bacterium]HDZ88200.1 50S ribosomal protein L20 [Nitrospirota bacterium]